MPSQRKILSPLKVVSPFSMKLGAGKKGLIYGFGRLSSLVGKPTSTSFGIGPVFGRIPNFGRLGALGLKKPPSLGVGRPISISNIPGPRLGSVGIIKKGSSLK
jgi:hypothetical protein